MYSDSWVMKCPGLLLSLVHTGDKVDFDFCHLLTWKWPGCLDVLAQPLGLKLIIQRLRTSARLVFELTTREHVTPSLLQLHWLPVRWRVQFKLYCMMHSVFLRKLPSVLGKHCSSYKCWSFTKQFKICIIIYLLLFLRRSKIWSYCSSPSSVIAPSSPDIFLPGLKKHSSL